MLTLTNIYWTPNYDDISEDEVSVVGRGCELDLLGDFEGSPSNRFHLATPDRIPPELMDSAAQVEEREKANSLTQSSDLRENGSLHPGTNLWKTGSHCPGPHHPGMIMTQTWGLL